MLAGRDPRNLALFLDRDGPYPQFEAFFEVSKLVLKTLADSVRIDLILYVSFQG